VYSETFRLKLRCSDVRARGQKAVKRARGEEAQMTYHFTKTVDMTLTTP
jgi:hypothetical protein